MKFQNAKVGDEVFLYRNAGWGPPKITRTKIERVTPKAFFYVDGVKLSKKDGHEPYGDGYAYRRSSYVTPVNEETERTYQRYLSEAKEKEITRYLQNFDYQNLSIEDKAKVFKVLHEIVKAKKVDNLSHDI